MAKSKTKPVLYEETVELEHQQETPEVENESQDRGDEPLASNHGYDGAKHNKASMVRAALAEGFSKPSDGCRWIKEMYGVEISGTYFSVAKTQQAKRSGEATVARTTPLATHHQTGSASASAQEIPAGFGSDVKSIRRLLATHDDEADSVKDLVAVVDTLVRKYGVSGLNEMIDAFAK